MENISNQVKSLVQSLSQAKDPSDIDPKTDLFNSGILDSVLLVSLLTKLEAEFKINVTSSEFVPENFTTLDGLTKLVTRLKANNEK